MDGENNSSGEKAGEKKPKKKTHGALRAAAAVVMTLLLAALALLVFFRRDSLTSDRLKAFFGLTQEQTQESAAFTYESGSGQVFAPAGDGLAVASQSSIQLFDGDGGSVFKQIVSFDTPAVSASGSGALFFDIGGTGCIAVGSDGSTADLTGEGTVITASVNSSGWSAVAAGAAGYKALVSVYDPSFNLVYKWWSGTGYVLKTAVCPDGKRLAVLCAEAGGSVIHIFSLDSEDELCSISCDGVLLFDMYFMGADRICALSEDSAYFFGSDGSAAGTCDFGGKYLCDYDFGSDRFAAICLSEYQTGSGGTVMTLSSSGEVLGEVPFDSDITSLSASGGSLLVASSGGLSLYSDDMTLQNRAERLMTAKRVLLRPGGDALLLSAYSAEIFEF